MSFVDLVAQHKLMDAKEFIFNRMNQIAANYLEEEKMYVVQDTYIEEEQLEEARSSNTIKMGRITKIRRRIRRNKQGRIIVQKNVRKSGIKGFRISGNRIVRIPAIQRIQKARKLKRYWKTKGKAKLRRTLLKRKMSIRRRTSMGIK
jgi:hypothetical protein